MGLPVMINADWYETLLIDEALVSSADAAARRCGIDTAGSTVAYVLLAIDAGA